MVQVSETPTRFLPRTNRGTIVLGSMILLTVGAAVTFFWLSSLTPTGVLFAAYTALGVVFCLPLPMLGYRLYALNRAYYDLNRNVLTIHWGLRTEILPLKEIQWIRPMSDLVSPLPKPRLYFPGAFLGFRIVEGLGKVEYLADRMDDALLVAAPESVYVLSPGDPNGFLAYYTRGIELGSLVATKAESIQPSFILGKIWDDRIIRNMILIGFLIGATIAIWTALIITSQSQVVFGAQAVSRPVPVPSIRLILLPVLDGLIFLIDVVAGAFFFRRDDQKFIAYLVVLGSSLSGIIILIVLLILTLQI